MRRFFSSQELEVGQSAVISGSDALHIAKVLRLKKNDVIAVFDGKGHAFECRIKSMANDAVTVVAEKDRAIERESLVHITLGQVEKSQRDRNRLPRVTGDPPEELRFTVVHGLSILFVILRLIS